MASPRPPTTAQNGSRPQTAGPGEAVRPPLPALQGVELLAPAGDRDSLRAAVENGADAVYLGGEAFNARKFAANFPDDALREAIDYAHVRGVRIFVTLNTLIFNEEFAEAVAFLRKVHDWGADAVIVQDLGVMRAVAELFPDLPLHLSTQATVHNTKGIDFLEGLGAERVILARENSLKEMAEMGERTGAELEQFVHGAMCYCYSGQCLMSSLIGGRSGNRGACAYTCRLPYTMREGEGEAGATDGRAGGPDGAADPAELDELVERGHVREVPQDHDPIRTVPLVDDDVLTATRRRAASGADWAYEPPEASKLPGNPTPGFVDGPVAFQALEEATEKHVISARDMNTLESVDRLIEAGIVSFKIEGRMKRPEYVAVVTRAYRNAIDRYYEGDFHVPEEEKETVRKIFNREFNQSWLDGKEKWSFTNWDTAGNQGIRVGEVVESGKGWVKLRLERPLRVKDGIEIVHQPQNWTKTGKKGAPEEYGFTVHQLLIDGEYTSEAFPGEVVEVRGEQWSAPGDPVFKTADIEVLEAARASYEDGPHRTVPVELWAEIIVDRPLQVHVRDHLRGVQVEHTSEFVVQPARKAPMTYENAAEQLMKLGDTPFHVAAVDIELGEAAFVPLSELNAARRHALDKLEQALAEAYHREVPDPQAWDRTIEAFLELPTSERAHRIATGTSRGQGGNAATSSAPRARGLGLAVNCWGLPNVRAALAGGARTLYFSGLRVGGLQPKWDQAAIDEAVGLAEAHGAALYLAGGMVQKDHEVAMLAKAIERAGGPDGPLAGVLAGNHGAFQAALEAGVPVVADWPLNIYNSVTTAYLEHAAERFGGQPVHRMTLSPELTLEQIAGIARHTDANLEVLAHGRLTLMTSEYCSIGHATDCQLPGGTWAPCHDKKYDLEDRLGKHFPLETDGACRMYILNSVELNMINNLDALVGAGVDTLRIETIGTRPEATEVQVREYLGAIDDLREGRGFERERWKRLAKLCPEGFTTGHFYRGPA